MNTTKILKAVVEFFDYEYCVSCAAEMHGNDVCPNCGGKISLAIFDYCRAFNSLHIIAERETPEEGTIIIEITMFIKDDYYSITDFSSSTMTNILLEENEPGEITRKYRRTPEFILEKDLVDYLNHVVLPDEDDDEEDDE